MEHSVSVRRPAFLAIVAGLSAMVLSGSVVANDVAGAGWRAAGSAGSPLLAQTGGMERRGDRRDDRQGGRDDRRDTRDECRDEGGAMGKDKRDCKQEGRQENRGPEAAPAPASPPSA
jgi:hypothetical protein